MGKEQGVRSGGPCAYAGSKTDGTGDRSEKEGLTMNKVYQLIDNISETVKQIFPKASKIMISAHDDGYINIYVLREEQNESLPVGAWKVRSLFDQARMPDGHFTEDRSREQNQYYKQLKRLLEE